MVVNRFRALAGCAVVEQQ